MGKTVHHVGKRINSKFKSTPKGTFLLGKRKVFHFETKVTRQLVGSQHVKFNMETKEWFADKLKPKTKNVATRANKKIRHDLQINGSRFMQRKILNSGKHLCLQLVS